MSRKSNPESRQDSQRLTARELILTLMDSTAARDLGVSYFVAAGSIFDMDPGNIRVALARLVKDGSLIMLARGRYGLGSRRGTLNALVRNWSRAENSLVDWSGGWLTILLGHLARSDKTQVRSNHRALSLYGFAEARPGLWLRPDNLVDSFSTVRSALIELGLDRDSVAAAVSRFEPVDTIDPVILWKTRELEDRYQSHIERLMESTARLPEMNDLAAARETLLVGRQVTRDILLDPLLPGELVDGGLRRAMVAAMLDYDRLGKGYWRTFFESEGGADQKPAA
jgi:phenylacetic acid degradation operon negative regulatory protein